MKLLIISRGNLEITRTQLRTPALTIGRSPTSDVILRAPGAQPTHFLVEWLGGGAFDPASGAWAVTDLTKDKFGEAEEGAVLTHAPVTIGTFIFAVIEDPLESKEVIGGTIQENLLASAAGRAEVLEVVQVRTDSGAIEEVVHRQVRRRGNERLLRKVPQFQIQWEPGDTQALLKILLKEMPGAEVYNKGQRINPAYEHPLGRNDLIKIRWRGTDFYLRCVDRVKAPAVPREVFGEGLMKQLSFAGLVLAAVVIVMVQSAPPPEKEPDRPPPRVATIEVKEVPPPAPKLPEIRPEPKVAEDKAPADSPPRPKVVKTRPSRQKMTAPKDSTPAGLNVPAVVKNPGKAAAPRFTTQEVPKPTVGLNSPAKQTDVNSVGILGALKKAGPAGKGVKVDQILNEGIVTEAASGSEESRIVVRNPPAGTIGTGTGGNPDTQGPGLIGASTTLSGAGKYDPGSIGPIARRGGKSGYSIGSGLGDGSGIGSGSLSGDGSGFGTLGGGEFSVEGGGLDRETVRRVIASYRNQIRTCYEKALLTSPNLGGRVVYNWTITPDGPVQGARIKQSSVGSNDLEACVLSVVRSMNFPRAPNGRSTRVVYPFLFQGRK